MPSEIEAKFYLRRLEPTLQRVQELGGRLAVRQVEAPIALKGAPDGHPGSQLQQARPQRLEIA